MSIHHDEDESYIQQEELPEKGKKNSIKKFENNGDGEVNDKIIMRLLYKVYQQKSGFLKKEEKYGH